MERNHSLLRDAAADGILLYVEAGRLKARAAEGAMTEAWRARIGGARAELLGILTDAPPPVAAGVPGETAFAASEAFWRECLADAPRRHGLPLDRPRVPGAPADTGWLPWQPAIGVGGLRERAGMPVAQLALAALGLLVARWSGRREAVVGVRASHLLPAEDRTDWDRLVDGVLATRCAHDPAQGRDEWLCASAEACAAALAHRALPLAQVRAKLRSVGGQAEEGRHDDDEPMFRIGLDVVDTDIDAATRAGTGASDLEWVLAIDGRDGGWRYDRALFDVATVQRIAESLDSLLAGLCPGATADAYSLPALPGVGDRLRADSPAALTLPGQGDRVRIAGWAAADEAPAFEGGLHERVAAHARTTPEAIALVCGEQRIDYRELDRRSDRVAARLLAQGVARSEPVGVCVGRSADWVIAALGTLKAGCAYLMLDPGHPDDRLRHMIGDGGVRFVATHPGIAPRIESLGVQAIVLDASPTADDTPSIPPVPALPEQMAYMVYTSGSTGLPKAVMLSHAGLDNLRRAQQRCFGIGPGDRTLQFASISFDASTWEWIYALANGATLVVCTEAQRASPEALSACLIEEGVTHALVPPAMLAQMDPSLPYGLRCLMVAGEALEPALGWRWASRFPMYNAYGPSETTVAASIARVRPDAPITIGRAIDHFTLHVVDDLLQPVPPGVAGELVVSGVGVGLGYRNRPGLDAEKFLRDPVDPQRRAYRTGDLVRMRLDGELEFLGRIDDQVKIRGHRVELGEVIHQLSCVPGVSQAHVVVHGGSDARRMVAYVRPEAWPPEGGEQGFARRIRGELQTRLPGYMLPAGYVFVPRFEMNVNGKIDRNRLPSADLAISASEDYVGPRNATESALCGIWQDVLKLQRVGVHDRFFAIGGDSILLIQAVARANREGLTMTARDIHANPSVAALASVLAARGPAVRGDAQEADDGDVELSPVQRAFLAKGDESLHHFNQSILLDVATDVDEAFLRSAMRALRTKHPALRLRFECAAQGWRVRHAGVEADDARDGVVVERLGADGAWDERVIASCERHQRGMDLARGPLFSMVLFAGPLAPRLLLLAHHLVIDGVSWRILLEDLQLLLDQRRAGVVPTLPGPVASFAAWMRRLAAHAAGGGFSGEREYWRSVYAQAESSLPVDRAPTTMLRHGDDASVDAEIDALRTASLLHDCGRPYRCGVQELLLAAAAIGLSEWTGRHRQWITMETHGRDALPGGGDPGDAVGWFTATYPLSVALPDRAPGAAVRSVKEALRAVPGNGLGHGWLTDAHAGVDAELAGLAARAQPQVLFNYLGRFEAPEGRGDRAFAFSDAPAGRTVGAGLRRDYLLGINAIVVDGVCRLSLDYSTVVHDASTMRELMDRILAALDRIIAHCMQAAPVWTPSDFPLARIDAGHLDALQAVHDIHDLYPATPMQKGMMFQSHLRPDAYVTQLWPMLEGGLDPAAMRAAWQVLIDRHDAFRTLFVGEIDRLLQLVVARAEVDWREEDWRALPAGERERAFERYREADRAAGFEPGRAPLQRVTLIRMETDRWWMLWTHQHMLVDGWSLPLVFGELMQAYRDIAAGRAPVREAAPRYRDHVEWLHRQDVAAALDYWDARLAGAVLPTPLSVAGAEQGMPVQGMSTQGVPARSVRRTDWTLDDADAARLLAFAKANELTPFTLVQLAWACVLAVRSGHRDVVYGATVSGRPADVPRVESIIGLFINTLPVRATLDPDQSVQAAARALQAAFRQDDLHGHVPLGEIQKRRIGARHGSLFDSLLVFENYPVDPAADAVDGAGPRLVGAGDEQQTEFAVTISAMLAERMHLRMVSRNHAIPEAEAMQLERALGDVLRAIPDATHVADLDRAAQGRAPGPADDVVARILAVARETPDAVAAECAGCLLRYGELADQADRVAACLRALGVGAGDNVGVLAHAGPEMLPAMLGVMMAGAAYLPLDPTYPRERLQAMLDVASPSLILAAPGLVSQATDGGVAVCSIEDAKRGASGAGDVRVEPLAAAYVIFTSGSTGRPKGVQVAHASLARLAERMRRLLRMAASDRVLQFSPIGFDVSVQEIFTTLVSGARLVFLPPGRPKVGDSLIADLRDLGITVATLTPSALASSSPTALPDLRLVVSGAEPLSAKVVDNWSRGRGFCYQYGPTEATVTSTARYCGDGAPPNIGWPLAGVSTYVVDETGEPLPPGATGELWIGGDALALGYLGDPAATADRFRPDPFARRPGARLYRSGDLVRKLDDGAHEFAGRNDGQVKLRGYRIELADVEAALLRHPAVEHAIALVTGTAEDDRRLVAYVQVADTTAAGLVADLRRHMRAMVAAYMCPAAIVPMAAFPVGVNGKVDKSRLPEPFDAMFADEVLPVDADDGDASIVAAILAEVIGLPALGIDDGFFDAGGDSLLAVKAMTRVGERFGIDANVALLFEAPSPRLLAARLPASAHRDATEALLREIDAMSEEDIMRLLAADDEAAQGEAEAFGR